MGKSKTRFSKPARWRPVDHCTMQQDVDGGYVRMTDYLELEQAYCFALVQLERAATRINGLMLANG